MSQYDAHSGLYTCDCCKNNFEYNQVRECKECGEVTCYDCPCLCEFGQMKPSEINFITQNEKEQ